MRKSIILFLLLLLCFLFSKMPGAKTLSVSAHDFAMTRKVIVKKEGSYRLLDSVVEKPGEYDFPSYHGWNVTKNAKYENTWNPIENYWKKKKIKKQLQNAAKTALQEEIKNSLYHIDIEKWENEQWIPYQTVSIYGENPIIIE